MAAGCLKGCVCEHAGLISKMLMSVFMLIDFSARVKWEKNPFFFFSTNGGQIKGKA